MTTVGTQTCTDGSASSFPAEEPYAQFGQAIVTAAKERYGEALRAIALTGSHAWGFATDRSDVDLIALLDGAAVPADRIGRYDVIVSQGRHAEILIVDQDYTAKLSATLNATRRLDGSFDQLELVEKMRTAIVLYGQQSWHACTSQFDYARLARLHYAYHMASAASFFDDCVGAFDAHPLTAISAARLCLYHQMEALLCQRGDTNGRRKWIFRRLEGHDVRSELAEGFLRYQFRMEAVTEDEMRAWAGGMLRFSQALGREVLAEGSCWPPVQHGPDEGQPFITPDAVFLSHLGKVILVKTADRSFQLDLPSMALLALCHEPRSEAALLAQVSALHPDTDIVSRLFHLRAIGLLREAETVKAHREP
ncbi:nucleotidyltransferase domain-containing protein [Tateyamaria sp. syn59]|uniref:nucleotidyltransferase domain-containing protein n=1 Tax=Tateyamaria sp. syn59 TaxID=2576942 RepID=UPI0011BE61BB|nr:nucleotidyltransferase domain-containing protein [Tateyamaria sp. syn59]